MPTERAAPERDTGNHEGRAGRQKLLAGAGAYAGILLLLWFVAQFFRVEALKEYPVSTLLAFAMLFAPYWLFGFGLATELRRVLGGAAARITLASFVAIPYFILELPRGAFHWQVAAVLVAIPVLVADAL